MIKNLLIGAGLVGIFVYAVNSYSEDDYNTVLLKGNQTLITTKMIKSPKADTQPDQYGSNLTQHAVRPPSTPTPPPTK